MSPSPPTNNMTDYQSIQVKNTNDDMLLPSSNDHRVVESTSSLQQQQQQPKKPDSMLKSFLAGGVGGVCVVLVGHPLDLIKVRMQTTTTTTSSSSVLQMFQSTFRQHGIRGLYRGVSAPLIGVSPIFALSFWGYDVGQRFVRWSSSSSSMTRTPGQQQQQQQEGELTLTQKCIAGGLSAIPTTIVMAPVERIKCLLQTSSTGQYKGFMDCAKSVYQSGGLKSLYRGTVLTLLRDGPGSVAWFGMYEWTKKTMMEAQGITDTTQLSPLAVLLAGGLAGIANWSIAIPPDVLKSRYQSAPDGTYKNIADVYKQLIQKEGHQALFAGLKPAMIRAFPANAACFMGMEVARKALSFMD